MSAEVATFERVRAAAADLRQRGIPPTAARVIEITGGSKPTVLSHLRRLREGTTTEADPLPPSVLELARAALVDVYEAGRRAEIERQRAVVERTASALMEQEAQIDELCLENARLEASNAEALDDAAKLRAEKDATIERLREVERLLLSSQEELTLERTEGAARLLDAMGKLDALLALHELSTMTPTLKRQRTQNSGGERNGE